MNPFSILRKENKFSILHSPFSIPQLFLHFVFCILLSFTLFSCSTSTKPETGSLSGKIILVNDTGDPALDPVDYSGITVALYNLAYLDTTIVRINNQYPQIGVQINQETEFDHRYQNPIATILTDSHGQFTFSDIPLSNYNIILFKEGWGIKYLYNISINSKHLYINNILQIILYPEIILSPIEQNNINMQEGHTYRVINDAILANNLYIHDDIFLLIDPGCKIDIYGNIFVYNQNNIFSKITTSDSMYSTICQDSLNYFDCIRVLNNENSNIENIIYKNSLNGLYFSNSEIIIDNSIFKDNLSFALCCLDINMNLNNVILYNNIYKGVECNNETIFMNNCIIINNQTGVFLQNAISHISNCFVGKNWFGIRPFLGEIEIENNCIDENNIAIAACALNITAIMNCFHDNLVDIEFSGYPTGAGPILTCNPEIRSNNFYGNKIYIDIRGYHTIYGDGQHQPYLGLHTNHIFPNNYLKEDDLTLHIYDSNYPNSHLPYSVTFIPRIYIPITSAGIN